MTYIKIRMLAVYVHVEVCSSSCYVSTAASALPTFHQCLVNYLVLSKEMDISSGKTQKIGSSPKWKFMVKKPFESRILRDTC